MAVLDRNAQPWGEMPHDTRLAALSQLAVDSEGRVYADVEDFAEVEPVGDLELKGFAKPVPTFNLLALKKGAT